VISFYEFPGEFTQHARNPARSVRIGGLNQVFAAVYGHVFVAPIFDIGRADLPPDTGAFAQPERGNIAAITRIHDRAS
jgi:hypothetical protein